MKTTCCHSTNISNLNGAFICLNEHCGHYLGKTGIRRASVPLRGMAIGVFIVISSFFSFENFSMKQEERDMVPLNVIERKEPFSAKALEEELLNQQILCPVQVLAQMKLESGHFDSHLFRHMNNLMGMRYPFSRPTTASGIYLPSRDTVITGPRDSLRQYSRIVNTYAVYDTWKDAVRDYKLWQDYSFKLERKYLDFLGKVYAEDKQYVSKLQSMVEG